MKGGGSLGGRGMWGVSWGGGLVGGLLDRLGRWVVLG